MYLNQFKTGNGYTTHFLLFFFFFLCSNQSFSQNTFNRFYTTIAKSGNKANFYFSHKYKRNYYAFGPAQALDGDSILYTELAVSKLDEYGQLIETSYFDYFIEDKQYLHFDFHESALLDSMLYIPVIENTFLIDSAYSTTGIVIYNFEQDTFTFKAIDFGKDRYEDISSLQLDLSKGLLHAHGYYEIDTVMNNLDHIFYVFFRSEHDLEGNIKKRVIYDTAKLAKKDMLAARSQQMLQIKKDLFICTREARKTNDYARELLLINSTGEILWNINESDSFRSMVYFNEYALNYHNEKIYILGTHVKYTFMGFPDIVNLRITVLDENGNFLRNEIIDSNYVNAREALPMDSWIKNNRLYVLLQDFTFVTQATRFPYIDVFDLNTLERIDTRNLKYDFADTMEQRLHRVTHTEGGDVILNGYLSKGTV